MGHLVHRSLDWHRVEWDEQNREINSTYSGTPVNAEYASLEVAFAREWEKENRPQPGLNQGHGILQNLMFTHRRPKNGAQLFLHDQYARMVIRPRDAAIAATVIQWLGTNVGRCFLATTLKKAGCRMLEPFEVGARERREQEQRKAEEAEWAWARAENWLEKRGFTWTAVDAEIVDVDDA